MGLGLTNEGDAGVSRKVASVRSEQLPEHGGDEVAAGGLLVPWAAWWGFDLGPASIASVRSSNLPAYGFAGALGCLAVHLVMVSQGSQRGGAVTAGM